MRVSFGSCGTGETQQTQSVEEASPPTPRKASSLELKSTNSTLITKQQYLRKQPLYIITHSTIVKFETEMTAELTNFFIIPNTFTKSVDSCKSLWQI